MLQLLPLDNILNILSYLSLDAVTDSILPINHYFWENREIFYKQIYFNAVYCCFQTIDVQSMICIKCGDGLNLT